MPRLVPNSVLGVGGRVANRVQAWDCLPALVYDLGMNVGQQPSRGECTLGC